MSLFPHSLAALIGSRGLYLAVFGAAALLSFVSLTRIRLVEDTETRRGLAALLVLSGLWASSHIGFLAAPNPTLSVVFYEIGLIVGLATVGPWLYFASAYTGRSYHRDPTYRRLAVGVFLLLVAVKLTNPIHGLYFATEWVTTPFPHLSVENQPLHWVVMGLSYALATVGYFMIFERFTRVSYDTRWLIVLVGVTGLPVVLDVAGYASPALLDITYEPIGVAVFAAGVFFLFLERFQSVRVAGEHDNPVVVLDDDGRIAEYNTAARELFPDRLGQAARGEPVGSVLPDLPDPDVVGTPIYEVPKDEGTRYYAISSNPFGSGDTAVGEILIFSDVTNRERYRRELERQNERLDQFASMISHDLRNPLNVASGRVELAKAEHDSEHLDTAEEALDRMDDMIEDVLALARQGQPIDESESVSLARIAEQSWDMVESRGAGFVVDGDHTFQADPDRLQQLFENLFRNAIDHAGTDVTVRVGPLTDGSGFYVADDGPGIPEENREDVFGSGFTTEKTGTGFGLAIVSEIVDAHGWSIEVGESEEGGARFEITGAET